MTKSVYVDILKDHPDLDEQVVYKSVSSAREYIQHENFDWVIDAHNCLRSRLICLFRSNVVRLPKFRVSRNLSIWFKKPSFFNQNNIRVKDVLVTLVSKLSSKPVLTGETSLQVNKIVQKKCLERLLTDLPTKNPLQLNQNNEVNVFELREQIKIVTLVPGAAFPQKCWPSEHFSSLINKLMEQYPEINFVIVGGPSDAESADRILNSLNNRERCLSYVGKLTLEESMAFCSFSSLVFTNDTGMMHIAEAFKIDVMAFFGPTTRDFGFFPYRPNSVVFEADLSCRPCSLHGKKTCKRGTVECLSSITPDQVFNRVKAEYSSLLN